MALTAAHARSAADEDGAGHEAADVMHQTAFVIENLLSVPAYSSETGVVAPGEGGTITVEIRNGSVEIFGDPAGFRDLARWCLALSDVQAPAGAHVHLDPATIPLAAESVPLMLARHSR